MPFIKRGRYYYHKGRKYTKKQIVAYYASGGTFSKAKRKKSNRKRK